jgi:hypothetical protein
MSVESIVDLRADASPRSLSVFAAAETKVGSTNPFDVSKGSADKGSVIAFVYGTDKGSIHYRTYAAPGPSSNQGGLSAQLNLTSSLTTPPSNRISSPLGANSSNQRSTNLPRAYYPVDLGSLGGPVVSCIKLGISQSNSTYLLLLVDDNRGTSATQPGAYSAIIVALTAGNFHIVVPSGNLPRMSCATFHSMTGLVYGAGRSIQVLRPETWEEEVKRGSRYAASRSKRLIFGNNICPAPGVRTGQDGMELTANGKVVIAVVGNTFHAIVGQEADERQQTGTEAASEHIKLISFSQSSQVHPVIALDLRDESLDADWSSLFLASGRECAVVDINYGPPSAPTLSASKPRNGIVTLASPIRAAAACWPWIVVLTNDGLVSVRPPSCLSVTLRTVSISCVVHKELFEISSYSYFETLRLKLVNAPMTFLYCERYGTKVELHGLPHWLIQAKVKYCNVDQIRLKIWQIDLCVMQLMHSEPMDSRGPRWQDRWGHPLLRLPTLAPSRLSKHGCY